MAGPQLPYITADVAGIGGRTRSTEDDFCVDEEPAYAPSGSGDHVYARIEKRGLTTSDAVRALAAHLGCPPNDVGSAGLKDKRAVTTQWLSFPPPLTTEAVAAADIEGVRVLEVSRHENKLRTGHLRGNHFRLVIRDTSMPAAQAAAFAGQVLDALARSPGSPNWYGAQRFGRNGDNARIGRALVTGERLDRRPPRGRQRRLFISAYQSELFNRYLRRRIDDGLYRSVLAGDLLQKRSGGMFECTEPEVDQARLDDGELAPTGPMFGSKMRAPSPETPAFARERSVLEEESLEPSSFRPLGKLALGARRPIGVPLGDVAASAVADGDDNAVEVRFSLPAGAYATAVLREIIKPDDDQSL